MSFQFPKAYNVSDTLKQAALEKEARALAAEDRMYKRQSNELNYQKGLEELNQLQQGMGSSIPNAVSEYNYFKSLPKSEQDAYLLVKRNPSQFNLGGQIGVGYDPYTGGFDNVYNKTVAPRVAIDAAGNPVMLGNVGGQGVGNYDQNPQITEPALAELKQTVAQDSMMGRQQNNAPALPSMPAQGNMGQVPINQGMPEIKYLGNGRYQLPNGKIGNAVDKKNYEQFALAQMKSQNKGKEEQNKLISKEYGDAYVNYTLAGPTAARDRLQSIETLNSQYGKLPYLQSGIVGGKVPAYSTEAQQFDVGVAAMQTQNNPFKGQGAVSNFERELLSRALPNRSYRKETLQKTFEAAKALKEIQDEKQKFVANWQSKVGQWNAQGEIALREYIEPIAREKFYALYPNEAGGNMQQPTMPASGGFIYRGVE